ncbi:MAG TPA: calcium/proton exchanger [Candidatus Acidoferrales bacterium]|nr:calcium/proton exchanger [Candidatus Acidoferrales bacterium]
MLLDALLAFVVIAPLAHARGAGAPLVFAMSALAIVPLAARLGAATEALASRLGAGAGGLLNATFGNAAELVLALVALARGYPDVVKASLTGSIVGNTLLVLGLAMLAGGARRERQTFDRAAASASATLLLLAAFALVVPAALPLAAAGANPLRAAAGVRALSLPIAGVLLAAYALSLFFSLGTHRHLYAGAPADTDAAPATSPRRALVTLLVSTALIAWMSELLVDAVSGATRALGLSPLFMGVVVVAIVGNAAEHSSAIVAAVRDRMDLAFHIAVGSSTQIALFVAPVLVLLSRLLPGRALDLLFTPFEVLAIVAAGVIVHFVAGDGESNWLEGAMLVALYGVLAIAFACLP